MKSLSPFALCMLIALLSPALRGDTPDLEAGVYIQDGDKPLDLFGHTAPTAADWNNDGKKDLLAGNIQGNIWCFLNQGTDLNPRFDGGFKVESGGIPITTAYS